MAQDREKWRALVNIVNDTSGCIKCRELYLAEKPVASFEGLSSMELQYDGQFSPCTISVISSLVYGCADVSVPHCCQPLLNCGITSCDIISFWLFSLNPWIMEQKKLPAFTELGIFCTHILKLFFQIFFFTVQLICSTEVKTLGVPSPLCILKLTRQIHIEWQSKHNYVYVIYKVLVYVQTPQPTTCFSLFQLGHLQVGHKGQRKYTIMQNYH